MHVDRADPETRAARMLALRDQVRQLWGDEYPARIAAFRHQVRDEAAHAGCPVVVAPPRIAERARRAGHPLLPLEIAVLVAAAVEEAEAGPFKEED